MFAQRRLRPPRDRNYALRNPSARRSKEIKDLRRICFPENRVGKHMGSSANEKTGSQLPGLLLRGYVRERRDLCEKDHRRRKRGCMIAGSSRLAANCLGSTAPTMPVPLLDTQDIV